MYAATLALALLVPSQPSHSSSSHGIVVRPGPHVQGRSIRHGLFGGNLAIKGSNNVIYILYSPRDNSLQYYNKQKRVNRLFWRLRARRAQ